MRWSAGKPIPPSPTIADQTLRMVDSSVVDLAVLLALDAAYSDEGVRDERTPLTTSNDFVAQVASRSPKTHFGASIHPYRADAIPAFERAVQQGAVLMKWLPGAQNIRPDDPRCEAMYEVLAHYKIPLLSHTGSEHLLKNYPNSFNDPLRLIAPLKRGVTVIAAHCGTRLFLHESSYFKSWQRLARDYERCYGDISAFGVCTRVGPLKTVLRDRDLCSKIVYGSDFPVLMMPLHVIGAIGLRRALELRRITNPFDLAVETMRELGVPSQVFARGAELLRIVGEKKQANYYHP